MLLRCLEQSGVRRRNPAEGQPGARTRGVERLECLGRCLGAHRGRGAPAIDVDQARQFVGSGVAVEVPGGIRRDHRSAERVATEHDLAAELLGGADHHMEVLDGDVHSPLLGELDGGVRDGLIVMGDARILQVAEVVVEQLRGRGLVLLVQVQLRLVLEQVLSPLDRPDLPATGLRDDPLGEWNEVGGGGRGARLQDQNVLRTARPDLDDPRPCCTAPGCPEPRSPASTSRARTRPMLRSSLPSPTVWTRRSRPAQPRRRAWPPRRQFV